MDTTRNERLSKECHPNSETDNSRYKSDGREIRGKDERHQWSSDLEARTPIREWTHRRQRAGGTMFS